jgi:glutamyl-tRNA synthetase
LRADGEEIKFADRILGAQRGRVDDFVVRRSDGVPAYQLAVIIDDVDQGIGEVVRGADLVSSTPRQILLGRLLGLPVPAYAHVPLVVGDDGARLAKRHGAVTLAERSEGPASVLAELAHTIGLALDRSGVARAAELVAEFDADRVPRQPVILPPSH